MSESSALHRVREMIESAESLLRSAKQSLTELSGSAEAGSARTSYAPMPRFDGTESESGETSVIEGTFDGQSMLGRDGRTYPVPPNYASKSKLVPGDTLKLTIAEDGSFIYKQIGPIERKRVIGTLIYEDGQFKVIANGRPYKVLLASVTYYKAQANDKVTIIVPAQEESDWGAIENVLPR